MVGLCAVVFAGCGRGFRPADYPNPQDLLDASMRAYRNGKCGDARVGFEQLTYELAARDPLQARLRYFLAECELETGEPIEAARQFRRVADEFPRHELAPDALLRAGDALAELWKRPQLDPSYGENAIEVWRELQGRYPSTTAAARSRLRIAELNEMFAQKSYENGKYYARLRAYDSAILYYQDVVARFAESSYAARALAGLIEVYDRLAYNEEKEEMCAHLRRFYPQAAADTDTRCPPPAATP